MFPKMLVPNNHGFPTKNDHFGVFWGVPPFKEPPIKTQHSRFLGRWVSFHQLINSSTLEKPQFWGVIFHQVTRVSFLNVWQLKHRWVKISVNSTKMLESKTLPWRFHIPNLSFSFWKKNPPKRNNFFSNLKKKILPSWKLTYPHPKVYLKMMFLFPR